MKLDAQITFEFSGVRWVFHKNAEFKSVKHKTSYTADWVAYRYLKDGNAAIQRWEILNSSQNEVKHYISFLSSCLFSIRYSTTSPLRTPFFSLFVLKVLSVSLESKLY